MERTIKVIQKGISKIPSEKRVAAYARVSSSKDAMPVSYTHLDVYKRQAITKPKENEVRLILDKLYEDGEMPIYYTFEERALLDPKIIAAKMNRLFVKDEDKEEWLKEVFESTPLLKELYKLFYVFKKTVFNACKLRRDRCV